MDGKLLDIFACNEEVDETEECAERGDMADRVGAI
jgi:hypothetical protein